MPIVRLADIVQGCVLVTATGAHFEITEPPVTDNAQVCRFFIRPVNRIGRAPVYHAGAVYRGSRFFQAQGCIGDLSFVTSFPVDAVVSIHAPGEVDLSRLPFSMDPGLFELAGGGRLLIQGTTVLLGRAGVVHICEVANAKIRIVSTHEEIVTAGMVAVAASVSKASEFATGDIFAQGNNLRLFRRKDHGIEPFDGLDRVPMSEMGAPMHALTTTRTITRFSVGDIVKGGSFVAKILQIDGRRIAMITAAGKIHESELRECANLPVTSEFHMPVLTWDSQALHHHVPPEPIAWPSASPASSIPTAGTIIQIGTERFVVYQNGRNGRFTALRLRRLIEAEISFGRQKHWIWADGDRAYSILHAENSEVYGLPAYTNHGRWGLTPEFGCLYLNGEGRYAAALAPPTRFEGSMVIQVDGGVSPDLPQDCSTGNAIDRYSLTVKLAGPGEWSLLVAENGVLKGAVPEAPEAYIVASGINLPVSAKGKQRIERLLSCVCPLCQARHSPGNSHRAILATGEVHVCRFCRDTLESCSSCHVNVAEFTNGFGVCPTCYAAGSFDTICSYSFKPKPKLHGEGPLYFGTEVELVFDGDAVNRSSFARKVIDQARGLFYAKNDGSIGEGIEFVSHPFSLPWLQESETLLRAVFATLDDRMRESSQCGIHIHTSKKGFGVLPASVPNGEKLSPERLITRGLMRVQRFIYGNKALTIHFAGRESSYASMSMTPSGGRGTPVAEMKQLAENITTRKNNRYAAVNMTRETVEFRIFKSTTDYDEYKRNVLFIDSVIQYCRHHALPKNGEVGIRAYRSFLNKHPALYGPVLEHLDEMAPVAAAAASF